MKDLNRKFFSKMGFILLVYSILHNVVGTLIPWLLQLAVPELMENSTVYYLTALLPTYVIAFPIVFLLMKQFMTEYRFPIHKMKVWQWILAFIIVYGFGISVNIITNIIFMIIRLFFPFFLNGDSNIVNLMSDLNPFVSILIVGIIAPVVEELVFRKLLIDRLIPYGEATAILLPGILFGIFHGNLQQCFFATVIGIFLSFIYVRTKKIHYTILMHMGVNLYACMYMILLTLISSFDFSSVTGEMLAAADLELALQIIFQVGLPSILLLVMLFVSFGLAVAGIVLFFVFLKRFKISREALIPIEKGKYFKTVILNPGMICFGLFWLVIFVINTIL